MRSRFGAAVTLAGALCALASSTASTDEPTADAVLADVPFLDSPQRNRVFVDLAPEGSARPFRLLLDTGATFSVLTPGAARELGVKVRRLKSDPYRRATRLGRDLQFYIDTQSSDTASRTGWEYGLLGGNFLAEYVVEFDFAARTVRFLDRKKFEVPESVDAADEAVLPLRVVSNRPGVELLIQGQTHLLLLDTGAPLPMLLSGEQASEAQLTSTPAAGFGLSGVYGKARTELGEARGVRIGPFAFEGVPVAVATKGWFNQGFPGDGVIGYDLLSQFLVRIDYPRRRIWLRRRPDTELTFLGRPWREVRRSGVLLDTRGEEFVRVDVVLPGGAAERRGLQPGDRFPAPAEPAAIAAAIEAGDALEFLRGSVEIAVAAEDEPRESTP